MGIVFPRKGEAPKGALSTCCNCTCNPWNHPRLMMSSNSHIHTAGAVVPMFHNNLRHPNSIPISPPSGGNENQPPFVPYKFFSFAEIFISLSKCFSTFSSQIPLLYQFSSVCFKARKTLDFCANKGKGGRNWILGSLKKTNFSKGQRIDFFHGQNRRLILISAYPAVPSNLVSRAAEEERGKRNVGRGKNTGLSKQWREHRWHINLELGADRKSVV